MIKAIIFDAFGTLFNLDKELLHHIDNKAVTQILEYARQKQLEYTWLHTLMESYIAFDEITNIALTDACRKYGVDTSLVDQLTPLYFKPVIFDDVIPCLAHLDNNTELIIGILSNGTKEMLLSGIQKNRIEQYVHEIFSVEDIELFKPHPSVYKMVTERLRIDAKEIMFVSGNQWDIAGAHNFGFSTSWVNRADTFREFLIDGPQINTIQSLENLVNLF